jgi:thiol:disulfide interchange protein
MLTALFVGMFALDAFGEGNSFWNALPHFLVHLIPAFLLFAVVGLAWRRAWFGALMFLAFAILYAIMTPRRPDWILAVGGPLALVGVFYLVSWLSQRWPGGPSRERHAA